MKVAVLGAGRVGNTIVRDLVKDREHSVVVADSSAAALERLRGTPGVETAPANLSEEEAIRRVVAGCDLVVGAVPGSIGFATLRCLIEAGKDVVDISFFPEDPFALDARAREMGCRALVDCGIAPGCSNLIAGRLATVLDRIDRFRCYVGGLPVVRSLPWEYKATFSPADVLEEYTRPARYLDHGVQVTVPALAALEQLEFTGVGTLEAFLTDGLRTLLRSTVIPFAEEKTLRYPGYCDRVRLLRDAGFLGVEPVRVGGGEVRPRDLTAALLFPAWELKEGEQDLTVMRVIVEGARGGRTVRYTYDLLDRWDASTGTSSMARTTGYTCTAAVRVLARGLWREPGIAPLELLGRDDACFRTVMEQLAARGITFRETVEELEA